jgi:hypothetical protein
MLPTFGITLIKLFQNGYLNFTLYMKPSLILNNLDRNFLLCLVIECFENLSK